ncbi:hypothetical protein E2562_019037 [Oryza meyeriana var. granulata]|uniref:Uncharacterized protein n=1 Tax=Oryza meyeriana var. granulata TaxID=110450 RepID=A0A6G1EMW7_9ORYZ|nr:hypothetical protein E2562_019037 [Oryza meyeriana var. granulata]
MFYNTQKATGGGGGGGGTPRRHAAASARIQGRNKSTRRCCQVAVEVIDPQPTVVPPRGALHPCAARFHRRHRMSAPVSVADPTPQPRLTSGGQDVRRLLALW